jgi:nitrogen regulatory protein P-II 1
MKEIKAIIRPNRLPALQDALSKLAGFPGMTVSRAEGCSASGRPTLHPASLKSELTEYTEKMQVEIVAPDEDVVALVNCIIQAGQTGHLGDGLVWVKDVEYAEFIHKIPSQIEPDSSSAL